MSGLRGPESRNTMVAAALAAALSSMPGCDTALHDTRQGVNGAMVGANIAPQNGVTADILKSQLEVTANKGEGGVSVGLFAPTQAALTVYGYDQNGNESIASAQLTGVGREYVMLPAGVVDVEVFYEDQVVGEATVE